MFLSKKTERCIIKMYIVLHVSARYSCQILIILEFSQQIFEKKTQINFMKIRLMGAQFFMRTDRHEEVHSRFSKFCVRSKKLQLKISFWLRMRPQFVTQCIQVKFRFV